MSDTTGWENIIDQLIRRDVEPIPVNFEMLLDAYNALSYAPHQPDIYLVRYPTWLMNEMAEPSFRYEYWTSRMEGDIEE